MRVAELVAPRRFEIVEGEARAPGPGEVSVRVTAVGICGSDMHAYAEGGIGGLACVYPMVLGHEPAGEIAALGPGVTGWAVGQRVACEPAIFCYHCDLCGAGRHNLCRHLRFLSLPGEPGFFREAVNLPVECLIPLPAGVSDAEGSLVEPLAVVLHSLALAGPVEGHDAAVFGAGPIGLLTVAALALAGARRIFAIEPLAHRRDMAIEMGAADAFDTDADVGAEVAVAFDCAAKADTADRCLAVTRPGGRVILTGIPSEARISVDPHLWRRKELALFQVRRSNQEAPAARDLLAAHPRRFGPLVTHRRPLERIGEAFELVARYADGVGKLVVTP